MYFMNCTSHGLMSEFYSIITDKVAWYSAYSDFRLINNVEEKSPARCKKVKQITKKKLLDFVCSLQLY